MPKALAVETGYFGTIREAGQEFDVPEGTKSSSWFIVDGDTDAAPVISKDKLPGVTPTKLKPAETNDKDSVAGNDVL